MNILSLDPGLTTGYALVDLEGHLLESGNIPDDEIVDSILMEYAKRDDIEVVQEFVPIVTLGDLTRRLDTMLGLLRNLFPEHHLVQPGQWKQNKHIVNYPFPESLFPESTPHQRDAFRLAIFYLTFLRKAPDAQTESVNNLDH